MDGPERLTDLLPEASIFGLAAGSLLARRRPLRLRSRASSARRRAALLGVVTRNFSAISIALSVSSSSSARRHPVVIPQGQPRHAPAPPWSRASGSPPPRPLAQAGAEKGWGEIKGGRPGSPRLRGHVRRGVVDLRNGGATPAPHGQDDPEEERRVDAMRRHPAGKRGCRLSVAPDPAGHGYRSARSCQGSPWHRVRRKETLWAIAGGVVGKDPRDIARYWPRIHHVNRRQIADPDLIYPGQVLRLPPPPPQA